MPAPTRTVSRIPLPCSSPATSRELKLVRYGERGSRPKAYLQAALHANEIPGVLVLHKLLQRLDNADRAGGISGEVVIVPIANPIGLGQYMNGALLGRFALDGTGNFNRGYPDLADMAAERVAGRLGCEAHANTKLIRAALIESLDAMDEAADEVDFLRMTLLRNAIDADIVLDLHCDWQAVLHVYLGTPLWPAAADLPAQLGSETTLLASESGGHPFDEAAAGPWWALAERFPDHPIPPACVAATVELRGEADVDEQTADSDADNLYRLLQRRGLVTGDPGPLPEPRCDATPLTGVDTVKAPHAGVVSYVHEPGDRVAKGEVVAVVFDPLTDDTKAARTEVTAGTDGTLYARRTDRLSRPGQTLCRIAGSEPLDYRIDGHLLSD